MPPIDAVRTSGPTRSDPAWLWLLAAALLLVRVASGVYEERRPPVRPDLMQWVPATEAPALAQRSGRPILYDFSAEWCGPCKVMEREVFADAKLANALSTLVVPVRVVDRQQEDGRNPARVDSLQRAHGVTGFPTLVLVGADGKSVGHIEGYPGAQETVKWVSETSMKARLSGRGNKAGATFTFP